MKFRVTRTVVKHEDLELPEEICAVIWNEDCILARVMDELLIYNGGTSLEGVRNWLTMEDYDRVNGAINKLIDAHTAAKKLIAILAPKET